MTELCLRLDQTEGYVPGETPVVFIGLPSFDTPEALGSVSQITGAWVKSTVGGGYYAAYFSYILQTPIRIGSESESPRERRRMQCRRFPRRAAFAGGRYAHRPDGIKKSTAAGINTSAAVLYYLYIHALWDTR